MGYRVAVVGATGNVGREMLATLAEREFPLAEVAAVASPRMMVPNASVASSASSDCPNATLPYRRGSVRAPARRRS